MKLDKATEIEHFFRTLLEFINKNYSLLFKTYFYTMRQLDNDSFCFIREHVVWKDRLPFGRNRDLRWDGKRDGTKMKILDIHDIIPIKSESRWWACLWTCVIIFYHYLDVWSNYRAHTWKLELNDLKKSSSTRYSGQFCGTCLIRRDLGPGGSDQTRMWAPTISLLRDNSSSKRQQNKSIVKGFKFRMIALIRAKEFNWQQLRLPLKSDNKYL